MIQNPTVRISRQAHRTLKELAARSGQPMQVILDTAIEEERRRRFVEEANASYARLRQNARVWGDVEAERATWDATLSDGLDCNEAWGEDEPVLRSKKKTRKAK
ncbi:MAG: toxin-antitoxin system protein [Armatimonadetes bacterium]|nr:toxin-antitoxin system protein [Armatimonadota bacterium]